MSRLKSLIILGVGAATGAASAYWYVRPPAAISTAAQAEQSVPSSPERKVLYYRNPMGLPDTSPVPKKDPMGMDYIPVYDDEQGEPGTVKVSLDKIQRIGVKTEKVGARQIVRAVRAVGKVEHDESLLTVVALRTDGFIEELFVNKTGQHVNKGEPLFRLYSPQIQSAQTDLIVAMRARGKMGLDADKELEGAMQRLRNLGVPQNRIDEVIKTGANPRTIDWPAPADGDVIEKNVINGQRVMAGDELYRIADHTSVWVIADVAESDIAEIEVGMPLTVTLRADGNRACGGQGDVHLSRAQRRNAHRPCSYRASEPR